MAVRDRLISFVLLSAFFLAFPKERAEGQNSHLNNLISAYKEQNGTEPSKSRRPAREASQYPPLSVQTSSAMPPISPPAMPGIQGGLLRDPHARPDDLINQSSSQEIRLATTTKPEAVRETVPLGGNPKDPLNADFVPYLKTASDRHVSPYDEMVSDARLNDVFFLDSRRGWAVGDRGAIWFTDDGGARWTLQETPISCTLRSVCFHDELFGFAVGGYPYPFTSHGRGIVLGTQDGGKNWTVLQTPDLPILHEVRIFDTLKVVLAGEASERHPTGLFLTGDGGRSWKPIPGGKNDGWVSIGLFDEKNGFGIDSRGVIQTFNGSTALSRTPVFGSTKPERVKVIAEVDPPGGVNGWMVGSGGLVFSTLDRGQRWGVVPGKLPGNSATMVDLKTIEARGTKLWVAGSPGTHIYSSNDLGATWKATPSNTTATIRKIVFADDRNGWAIGELGTILKTEDGGDTWKPQRSGGTRLAVLGVFGRADEIPWEAFISLCAHQGYLGGTALVFREQDRESERLESAWFDRVHEAVVRTGAVGLWPLGPFRLERKELLKDYDHLVRSIQEENDGKGMQRLRERMVALIRQWKPEIILTSDTGNDKDPARELVLREVMEAVKMSDDPTAFPHQLTELGLEPWKVRKVHVALNDGTLGDVNLPTMEPSIRLGQPVDELAFVSRGMLETDGMPRLQAAPTLLGFSTPYDQAVSTGSKDFFAGIQIVPGSEARRALIGSYAERWDDIRQRIQQRRHTVGIIRKVEQVAEENGRRPSDVRLASNAVELTRKIDRDAAVRILMEIGQKYHAAGDWESACEAYEIIARQYTQHPLARHAFLWLLQYQAGEEPGWRMHRKNVANVSQAAFNDDRTVSMAALGGASVDRHRIDPRLDKGLALGRYLNEKYPDLAEDPRIRFALASALRRCGNLPEALKYYRSRGRWECDDVWGMRARTELWLAVEDKSELPKELEELPMPAVVCSYTGVKPWLDGHFDRKRDSGIWFGSRLYSFTPENPRPRLREMLKGKPTGGAGLDREEKTGAASKNFGTRVMLLYDREFLYIGLRCPRVAGFSYPPIAEKPRARDLPIEDQDRIEILLDVDRDYGTNYSLTIDSRGWLVDACWGDKSWSPECFVAREEDKESWYIEAAVSLSSLTDCHPAPGSAWGVGMRRIVPGVGIECWNAENSFDLAEGIGPLLFE